MARKSIKSEQLQAQRTPVAVVATEQPISSGDTIAIDSDVTMTDGPRDEGHHMVHEHKKTGKS